MDGFDRARLDRLHGIVAGHVDPDTTGGVAWLVARGDQVAGAMPAVIQDVSTGVYTALDD